QPRYGLQAVSFGNQLWVIGGNTGALTLPNDVWSSSNGQTWSQVTAAAAFPGRALHQSLAFADRLWVIAGADSSSLLSDVWSSTDGITRRQATGSAACTQRSQHQAFVLDNQLCSVGGNEESIVRKNDAWCSAGGANWSLAYRYPVQFP